MPASIRIRGATTDDAPRLADLLSQLGYPASAADVRGRLTEFGEPARAAALVAETPEGVLGLVTCHVFGSIHSAAPVAWLTTLVVDSTHVGQGVGRALVDAAEQWARAHGALRVSVSSGAHRADAHRFYRRIGYEQSGVRFSKTLGVVPLAT